MVQICVNEAKLTLLKNVVGIIVLAYMLVHIIAWKDCLTICGYDPEEQDKESLHMVL
jgi:hypothetical protein